MKNESQEKALLETKHYRRTNTCEYCADLDCKHRKAEMVCDDFVDAGFVRRVPGMPPLSPRDWQILNA